MTKITNAKTGEDIGGVTRIELTMDVTDEDPMPRALLLVVGPVFDIIADAEIKHVCPVCGRENIEQEAMTEEEASDLAGHIAEWSEIINKGEAQ